MAVPEKIAVFSDAKTIVTPKAIYHAFLARDEGGNVWLAIKTKPSDSIIDYWTRACWIKFDGKFLHMETSQGIIKNEFGMMPTHFQIRVRPDGVRIGLSAIERGITCARDLFRPLTEQDFLPWENPRMFLPKTCKNMPQPV